MIGLMVPNVFAINTITNQSFLQVAENPEGYIGTPIRVSGHVDNKQVYDNAVGYVFTVGGFEIGQKRELWFGHNSSIQSLSIGDCVIVEGIIEGKTELVNTYGTVTEVPYFWITNYQDYQEVDCLEAMHPTIAESTTSQTQQKGNAKVTIEKVQFTNQDTRIYFIIENTSVDSKLWFWHHDTVIIQDKKQFEPTFPNVFFDHPELFISHSVPYGTIEEGWLTFERVEPHSLEIRLEIEEEEGFGEYYFHPMVFNINSFSNIVNSTPAPTPAPTPTPTDPSPDWADAWDVEPVPTPTPYSYEPTHIENYPDPTKSPEYYLDRYNNEITYKDWFDSQFPNKTIYDVLGLPEPTQPEVEPEPTVQNIPDWVRNIFIWYGEEQISESEVINAIKFLINQGVINLDN